MAEDELPYASVYKSKLENESYDVVIILDGAEVMEELRKKKPDLLILDLVLPGKDGFEILKEIRADANLKDLVVVVASNLSQESDKEKIQHYGVAHYFVKSDISISEMVAIIKSELCA